MNVKSAEELVGLLRSYSLVSAPQLEQLRAMPAAGPGAGAALLREAVRQNWLTVFQADLIARGCVDRLAYGAYRLIDRLGRGGVGQVFRAWDLRRQLTVALKVVQHELRDNPEILGRFQREVRAVRQLNHPNIVRAIDAQVTDSGGFLAMEYLSGSDLRRTLEDGGPLPVATACSYARQAALGLQHAHEHGIVHRDVKPDNLMLTTGGVVKLLDLGLVRVHHTAGTNGASVSSAMTIDGEPLGTPDYMAPEQAKNPHGADIRADVYSLGCTLYELLTGRPPFDGGAMMQKLYRHQREDPRPIDRVRRDVPPALAAAIARMLAKDPAGRFAVPREVADQLAAFAGLQ